MGGLERICESILADARAEVNDIMTNAQEKIEELWKEYEEKRDNFINTLESETQRVCMATAERIEAEAASRAREIMLAKRSEGVEEISRYIMDSIINAPDKEYFDILVKLLKNNREEKDGVVYLSKRDLARLPEDFCKRINQDLNAGKLTISDKPIEAQGGFIIEYGNIDINCRIESIFEAKKNAFSDIINGVIA